MEKYKYFVHKQQKYLNDVKIFFLQSDLLLLFAGRRANEAVLSVKKAVFRFLTRVTTPSA